MTPWFIAEFEDRAKIAALLKADDDEDSAHEIALQSEAHTSERFATLNGALDWAKARVEQEQTFYGVVTVSEYETVPRGARCRYCICRGNRCIRYHNVDETGIIESFSNDDCADD